MESLLLIGFLFLVLVFSYVLVWGIHTGVIQVNQQHEKRSLSHREIVGAIKKMPLSQVNKTMGEVSQHFKEYWDIKSNAQFVYEDDHIFIAIAPLPDNGGVSVRKVDGKTINLWLYDQGKQEHHDFWLLPIELYQKLITPVE